VKINRFIFNENHFFLSPVIIETLLHRRAVNLSLLSVTAADWKIKFQFVKRVVNREKVQYNKKGA